jgi:putative mRNA 3-end processing factor
MIGASQFRITTPEKVILYTGDLNYVNSLVVEAAEPKECDVLIVEATYGAPLYNFPPKTNVYSDIVRWTLNEIKCGRNPCFRVYAAGKAQEIVKLFTKYTKIPIICDNRIHSVNEICNNKLLNLRWSKAEYEPDNKLGPLIFVTSRRSYSYSKFSEARATGWALKMRNSRVRNFPLSGHADFNNLNRYVQETKAKEVYVFTGFKKEFSEYLRRKGLNAEPIPPLLERNLFDFM